LKLLDGPYTALNDSVAQVSALMALFSQIVVTEHPARLVDMELKMLIAFVGIASTVLFIGAEDRPWEINVVFVTLLADAEVVA